MSLPLTTGDQRPGNTDWWKWTAACLAALLVGLIPFFITQARYVRKADVDSSTAQIQEQLTAAEAAILLKIEDLQKTVAENTAEIEAIHAQFVDLADRIEQLRVTVANLTEPTP